MELIAPTHAATFVAAGNSAADDHRVKLTVPFNFVIGTQMLPSGNYLITSKRSRPEALSVGNWDKKVQVQAIGQPILRDHEATDVLVFYKYRSLYFLTDIQFANSATNIHFPATIAETSIMTRTDDPDSSQMTCSSYVQPS